MARYNLRFFATSLVLAAQAETVRRGRLEEEPNRGGVVSRHTAQAFALVHMDVTKSPPVVLGIGFYSSDSITLDVVRQRTLCVETGYGVDYESGLKDLASRMNGPWNTWMLPLLDERAKAHMEHAGKLP